MSYLVLARKYRPERFSDMLGQEHITRVLGQAIEQSRLHHAYLFCGVRGLGKTSAARILARCLVCEQGPSIEPCNECEQCLAVTQSRSVDVREIDGASHNSVDDIRALREQVHYLPQSARKKIYIIDEVHMLTTSAFNALLKTLEEPPEHVLFIFATTDPHKVLPTILSRVSRLDFRRVQTDALAQHLSSILDKEGGAADEQALRIVARSGEGSVRDALTQLDKVLAFCANPRSIRAQEVRSILGRADPHALSDIVDAIFERDVASILQGLDDVLAQGAEPRDIALGLLREFRNLVVLRLTPESQALVDEHPERVETLKQRAQGCDPQHLHQLFDRLMRSCESLGRALNSRLALEMALIELAIAPPLSDLSKVIAQLNDSGSPASTGSGATHAQHATHTRSTPSTHKAPPRSVPARQTDAQPANPSSATARPPSADVEPKPQPEPFAQQVQASPTKAKRPPANPAPATPERAASSAVEAAASRIEQAHVPAGPSPSPALERWKEMLQDLRESNDAMLLAMVCELGVHSLDASAAVLWALPSNFSRQKLEQPGPTRERFEQWLQRGGLDPQALRWVDRAPDEAQAPSWTLFTARARSAHRVEVSHKARAHAGVQAVVKAFDAEITDVRVLRDHRGQPLDSPLVQSPNRPAHS